jgi:hypothetical protein
MTVSAVEAITALHERQGVNRGREMCAVYGKRLVRIEPAQSRMRGGNELEQNIDLLFAREIDMHRQKAGSDETREPKGNLLEVVCALLPIEDRDASSASKHYGVTIRDPICTPATATIVPGWSQIERAPPD